MHRINTVLLALLLAAASACSDDGPARADLGPDARPDRRVVVDPDGSPQPPDQGPPPDGAPPPQQENIGEPCTDESGCKPGSPQCLMLDTKNRIGICTKECQLDDPETKFVDEDKCGLGYRCSDLGKSGAPYLRCLKVCTPSLTANPCPPGSKTTCSPVSTRFTGTGEHVCFYLSCNTHEDCAVYSMQTCSTSSGCTDLGTGAFCDTGERKCALPGNCTPGGICGPHAHGKAGAQVGDPCQSDLDCPGQGFCFAQSVSGGVVHSRNGYCALRYCAAAGALPEFKCPAGSACNRLWYGGVCFKSCTPADPASCRGVAGDLAADYECYSWNRLYVGGTAVSEEPICSPARGQTCDSLGSKLTCDSLGAENNPTRMRCRNPLTGEDLPERDPAGVCLDDTASGPFPKAPDGGVASADAGPG